MIAPNEVHAAAAKLERENLHFRSFLKGHADDDELDRHIHQLHNELFSHYDCNKCRNCCRAYRTLLSEDEIDNIAAYLGLPRQEFIESSLIEGSHGYELDSPCWFCVQTAYVKSNHVSQRSAGPSLIQIDLTVWGACSVWCHLQRSARLFLRSLND